MVSFTIKQLVKPWSQLGWGIASKPEAQKRKQHFKDKNLFFDSHATDH